MNKKDNPTEHDAERFLTALQESVQELLVLSKVPTADPTEISFIDYTKFREKTDECLSFLVIIEGRINEVEGERKELLSEQFDKLVTATWSVLMEGSISFLSVLSEREYLPVGTRHVFEQELKTLSEAEEVMKENKNEKFLASNMTEKRAKAREILNVVIEKAPELLNVNEDQGKESLPLSSLEEVAEVNEETTDAFDRTVVAEQEPHANSEIDATVSDDIETSEEVGSQLTNESDGQENIEAASLSEEDSETHIDSSINAEVLDREDQVENPSLEPKESYQSTELDKEGEGQLKRGAPADHNDPKD